MKKKVIVIDDVTDVDSNMHDDYDDDMRFVVNEISGYTSVMSEEVDVPIICLDYEDDDLKFDKGYKLFLDNVRDDTNLGPVFVPNATDLDFPLRYEADSGKSETRKLKTFSGGSERSKLENMNPMKNRKRKTVGFKAESSKQSILRDNRIAERRKRRIVELEAERTVTLVRNQENIRQGDNKVGKAETVGDPPLVRTEEDIQVGSKASEGRRRKAVEIKTEAERTVPLVRNQESIRRGDNKVRKFSELETEIVGDPSLVRTEEDIQVGNKVSEGRKRKAVELKTETSRKAVSLVRTEKDIQQDNILSERRKRRIAESKAVKVVNETSIVAQVSETNKEGFAGKKTKNEKESVVKVDKHYMSYLTWLVDSLKDFTTKPIENLQKDTSIPDTLNLSTTTIHEKALVKVKAELDLDEPWSNDPDIIAIGDSPFLDGESTPFVVSKSMIIDLDKETTDDKSRSLFKKELMKDLSRPYDEAELLNLSREVSIHRRLIRSRELRKGREAAYETDELGHSYLERFKDFNEVYRCLDGNDKTGALKLLRGFFFYLKNLSHDGAFKPWMD